MDELKELLSKACPNIDFNRNDLITAGLIDSLAFVKIISVIEANLNITLDIMNIEPEDFESVENILKLIEKNK